LIELAHRDLVQLTAPAEQFLRFIDERGITVEGGGSFPGGRGSCVVLWFDISDGCPLRSALTL